MDSTCPTCHAPIAPGAMVCPNGHALQSTDRAASTTPELQSTKVDFRLSSAAEHDLRPMSAPAIGPLPDEPIVKPGSVGELPSRLKPDDNIPEVSLPAAAVDASPPPAFDILAEFRLPEDAPPLTPLAVQLGPDATVHVLDAGQPDSFRWVCFSKTGDILQSLALARGTGGLQAPAGIALDREGRLYVVDLAANCVRRYTPGGQEMIIGQAGSLNGPLDVALDGAGNLVVAESIACRVTKLDPAGTCLLTYGSPERSVQVDEEEEEEGEPEAAAPSGPPAPDRLANPGAVAVDQHGSIYIADTNHHRVLKLDANGAYTGLVAQGVELLFPSSLKVLVAGDLFVADLDGSRIHRFDPAGGHVFTLTFESGIAGGEFDVDDDSQLYLASKGNQAVLKVRYAG